MPLPVKELTPNQQDGVVVWSWYQDRMCRERAIIQWIYPFEYESTREDKFIPNMTRPVIPTHELVEAYVNELLRFNGKNPVFLDDMDFDRERYARRNNKSAYIKAMREV
ncbi:MAG: hypothetical protein SFZ02_12265 [bacterium]|nr:hypothetical protein [bacterium]